MGTMMLFLVLAVQLAPCYGNLSVKLQEMIDEVEVSYLSSYEAVREDADCKYYFLGSFETMGGRTWTPCMNRDHGDCSTYRVDGVVGGHAYWNSKWKADTYCAEWKECEGYWKDYKGRFWAVDFNAMYDMKRNRDKYQHVDSTDSRFSYHYGARSNGAWEKVCGKVANYNRKHRVRVPNDYVKRNVANCDGFVRIESKEECERAARKFGLNGLHKDTPTGTYSADPDGCYYYLNTEQLYYNSGGDTQCTETKPSCKNRINLCSAKVGTRCQHGGKMTNDGKCCKFPNMAVLGKCCEGDNLAIERFDGKFPKFTCCEHGAEVRDRKRNLRVCKAAPKSSTKVGTRCQHGGKMTNDGKCCKFPNMAVLGKCCEKDNLSIERLHGKFKFTCCEHGAEVIDRKKNLRVCKAAPNSSSQIKRSSDEEEVRDASLERLLGLF